MNHQPSGARPLVVSLMSRTLYDRVMTPEAEAKLCSFARLVKNEKDSAPSEAESIELLRETDGCITGWGVKLTEPIFSEARKLRIVGHTAGSVKSLVPLSAYDRGVVVTNAARTIAKSVGEMAFGLTLASLRNFPEHDSAFKQMGTRGDKTIPHIDGDRGLHGARVGIIGASMTGREFLKHLKPYSDEVEVWLHDPYVSAERAAEMGVKKVGLDELLSQCDVISLHAPATDETVGMIGPREVKLIKSGAVFVNTARGKLVDHDALLAELKTGRFKAALDVYLETVPEARVPASEYRKLKNVLITPGIAGPSASVLRQLGMTVVNDMQLFFSGRPPLNRVTKEMLRTMA